MKIPTNYLTAENPWNQLRDSIKKANPSAIFILTDTNTQHHCLPVLLEVIPELKNAAVLCVEAGEETKNIDTCLSLWKALMQQQADRTSLLVNLGGGMVTDLGGFVAATFKRGIQFIHIPTSLLGMVDAAIGGKNGINFLHAKNQIGTLVMPRNVVVYAPFLKTLPARDFISGTAEMFKHGLIFSKKYWQKLKNTPLKYAPAFTDLIIDSITIKNQIVLQDAAEKHIRKSLNFGHTLGHAVESVKLETKAPLLHGEAVAVGMILEGYLSYKLLGLSQTDLTEITQVILKIFPKINFSDSEISNSIAVTKTDKKNKNGKVLFVLLKEIGVCEIDVEVPEKLLFEAFDFYKNS
jgi:3-dehydroquinate synthase